MTSARRGSWVVAGLLASLLLAGRADGKGKGKVDEVRDYLDKATAAFALSRYAVAAENYEKAFELKPDPAVLYNAAQAHRLAGNKERALELYQSYLRMYGAEKRAEVEKHVENLKQAIEKDHAVATSPPTTPAPVGGPPSRRRRPRPSRRRPGPSRRRPCRRRSRPARRSPPPLRSRRSRRQPTPVLVTQASPPPDDGSIVKKPWFWIVVGGAVVAAAVGGFLLFRRRTLGPDRELRPTAAGKLKRARSTYVPLAPALAALLAAVVGCGGGTRACKQGTLFVTIVLDGTTSAADVIAVRVSIDGGMAKSDSHPRTAGGTTETIEINFPSEYPAGKRVDVQVTAYRAVRRSR